MPPLKRTNTSIVLQERDLLLLKGLFECRVMTIQHAAALYFDDRKESAKKRIQKLRAARLLKERTRRVNEPSILSLTKQSLELLRHHGALINYPVLSLPALAKRTHVSDLTVRHELEVMDVKVAFHSALKNHDSLVITEFGTWPRIYQFKTTSSDSAEPILVRPDGYFRINQRGHDGVATAHKFFLEVDRSTETQDKLASRASCYLEYYRSGGFALRHGAPRTAFKNHLFRVVMVFKTAERRNNMAKRLLQNNPPILAQAYLSTIDQVREDPLDTIWLRPVDYRDALTRVGLGLGSDRPPRQHQDGIEDFAIENALVFRRLLDHW